MLLLKSTVTFKHDCVKFFCRELKYFSTEPNTFNCTSFEEKGKQFRFTHKILKQFCSFQDTVFHGTSTVEGEFSRVCKYRRKGSAEIGNLPITGVMHSRQWIKPWRWSVV